jgi:hypothetical protein
MLSHLDRSLLSTVRMAQISFSESDANLQPLAAQWIGEPPGG